jgi:hypothetical protein
MLAIILVMGSRAFGSASCTKCLSAARENPCFFQVAGQASGQSVVGSIQGLFCEADQRSVGNCTQPSHAKYSAEVFKEENGQKSPWRTREVARAVDRDQLMRGFIS